MVKWSCWNDWLRPVALIVWILSGCSEGDNAATCSSPATEPPGSTPVDYCGASFVQSCCEQYCLDQNVSAQCRTSLNLGSYTSSSSCFADGGRDCDGDGVKSGDDCDDCNASRGRWLSWYEDADSDGYPIRQVSLCEGDAIDPKYTATVAYPEHFDCDDERSDRWQYACRDSDGDGWCAAKAECVGSLPATYRLGDAHTLNGIRIGRDCDDTDPTKQREIYGDEDADGRRASTPSACYPNGDRLPPGYAFYAGDDCNDHDPLVYAEQADFVGDGVDANCDGADGGASVSCAEACRCWPTPICPVATTCPDRSDPAIVDMVAGSVNCRLATTGLIALIDRGGLVYRGAVTIGSSDFYGGDLRDPYCWYDTTFELELGPGQGKIIEIDPLCQHPYLVVDSGDDCDPSNNAIQFHTEVSCGI